MIVEKLISAPVQSDQEKMLYHSLHAIESHLSTVLATLEQMQRDGQPIPLPDICNASTSITSYIISINNITLKSIIQNGNNSTQQDAAPAVQ